VGRVSEWQEMTLGDVLKLQRGHDLPSQKRTPGDIPIISSSGITDYHSESAALGPGVITGRYGTIGQVFYTESDYWPLNTTLYVKDFKGNDPKFVFYLLKTVDFHQFNDKSSVPGVNRNHVHMAQVKVPKPPTQRQIAAILSAFDDKIELNRQMNRTLEQIARALFRSWFVDFDPVRAKMRGKVPQGIDTATASLFPDELAEMSGRAVPKGWRVGTVGDTFTLYGGSTPSTTNPEFWENGEYYWTTPKDMSGLDVPFLTKTERKITRAGVEKITSGVLPIGTVLLSSRAPVGYLAIADIPISINQGYIGLDSTGVLGKYFIFNFLQSQVEEIKGIASGTTFMELSKKVFRYFKLVIPPKNLTDAFETQVDNLYSQIRINIYESTHLAQLRDSLLPRLLSGEVDVSEWETEEV
jgi:type I restriction enzyme S subunit